MLKIQSISLVNFGVHKNSTFIFSNNTTLISGNNGSGKSTVIRAIGLALFDYKPTTLKDLISRGAEYAEITVEFEYGNHSCSIYRRIGTEQKTALMVDGELVEMYKESYAKLSYLFGIKDLAKFFNELLYIRSSYLTYLFLLEKSKRKLIIENILDIERFNVSFKLRNIIKDIDIELSKKKENASPERIGELENSIFTTENEIENHKQVALKLKEERDRINNLISAIISPLNIVKQEIESCSTTLNKLNSKKYSLLRGVCPTCNQKIEINNAEIDDISKQIETLTSAIESKAVIQTGLLEGYDKLKDQPDNIKNNIELVSRQLYLKQGKLEQLKYELHRLESVGIDSKRINKLEDLKIKLEEIHKKSKELPAKISNTLITGIVSTANELLTYVPNKSLRIDIVDYDLLIEVNDKKLSYELLSDGEKIIVALLIRIAMIRRMSNLNLYILDEPTINLDSQTKEELLNIFGNISGQMIVISHDTTFSNVYNKEILL